MAGFSASIDIDAAPAAVFELISDVASHGTWASDDLTLERTGEHTWRSTARAKASMFHADIIVTVNEPARLFEFVASDETGTFRHRFTIEPSGDGCRVTRAVSAERLTTGQWVLYWAALVPVRRPALRASMERLAAVATSGFA